MISGTQWCLARSENGVFRGGKRLFPEGNLILDKHEKLISLHTLFMLNIN